MVFSRLMSRSVKGKVLQPQSSGGISKYNTCQFQKLPGYHFTSWQRGKTSFQHPGHDLMHNLTLKDAASTWKLGPTDYHLWKRRLGGIHKSGRKWSIDFACDDDDFDALFHFDENQTPYKSSMRFGSFVLSKTLFVLHSMREPMFMFYIPKTIALQFYNLLRISWLLPKWAVHLWRNWKWFKKLN
jgi:hypothetical protein